MIALVTGGRTFGSEAYVHEVLDKLYTTHLFDALVQGGADGVDMLAEEWCFKRGCSLSGCPRCGTFSEMEPVWSATKK